ncbi:MAG: maltose alpha-D-glucosyltransferase [Anaerolineales bacterium]|nr:maltose alpha-D-glucosyltransferase [Anaerolineales bacterium]
MAPLWYKNALFYELPVRAFYDSNGDGHGDLAGVTRKLDYLQALGVDCLWLPPIYPSPLLDGGYDIADYYGIHPDFGTMADFKQLLTEAKRRGLRVIADLVLNHTSASHPWFQAARADRASPYRDYYVWNDTDQRYQAARIIFLDTETSNWAWDQTAGQYYWHRFYSSQPDLNYDNPAVQAEMLNVLKFWLDQGLDGFRCDAVPYLIEREGTNCENLPETHKFIKTVRNFVETHYPDCVLLAEANQWPHDLRPYFGDNDEFHMAFHFPVMPRIFMALGRGDASALIEILKATPAIPPENQWCTFLRNHDELTLEMVTDAERLWMWRRYAPEPRMRLNLGIRRRLAPLLGGDARQLELANALLFALPGTPIFYYGDEIGMGDNIWLPDRDGLRTPFQWDAGPNAGFSSAAPEQLYAPVVAEGPFSYQRVNLAAQLADSQSLWHRLRRLVTVRKAQPVFGCGEYEFLPLAGAQVFGLARRHAGEVVVALHNLTAEPQRVEIDPSQTPCLASWQGASAHDLVAERAAGQLRPTLTQTLGPYSYCWLKLEKDGAGPP